jgi:hypothetical protein
MVMGVDELITAVRLDSEHADELAPMHASDRGRKEPSRVL